MSVDPVRFGLTGLGGYAGVMCERLLAETASRSPRARLAAVCEPHLERFGVRVRDLARHGIVAVRTFDELLQQDIEAVLLPLPIDLHRPYTEAALAAGKAVLCEKPAAGCVDDVDAMIAARDRAGRPVAIGFQHAYQPPIYELKRRLLSGEFGRVRCCTVVACWPRGRSYYARNDWAGRLRRNGRWVMDSPASNAMAHHLHEALFLLGPGEREAAAPMLVEAELYRANPIENYDTCSLRIHLAGGVRVIVGYTHACKKNTHPEIRIETERASIRCLHSKRIELWTNGNCQTLPLPHPEHVAMLEAFRKWVREGSDAAIAGTLESARSHIVVVNAASEAAPIVDVPDDCVRAEAAEDDGAAIRVIHGIEQALLAARDQRCMLHETRQVSWARPGGAMSTVGYAHFSGPRAAKPVRPHIKATVFTARAVASPPKA